MREPNMRQSRVLSYHADIKDVVGPVTVRAVFTRSLHLQVQDGWIVTVTSAPWNGPLTVRVPGPSIMHLGARPGYRGTLSVESLNLPSAFLSLRGAVRWRPCPLTDAPPLHRDVLEADVERCWDAIRETGRLVGDGLWHPPPDDAAQPHAARDYVGSLLGRGNGLTPDGDDVLVGVMIGLHSLSARSPRHRVAAGTLLTQIHEAVAEFAPAGTTALSRTLLRYAADGVAVEPVLHIARTLGSRGPVRGVESLLGVGHTSGSAILSGVLLAAQTLLRWEGNGGSSLVAPS